MTGKTTYAGRAARVAIVAALAGPGAPTTAAEHLAYEYDPLGRLTRVGRTGTVNNGIGTVYHYDTADNRIVKWTGTGTPPPAPPPNPPAFRMFDASAGEGDVLDFTVARHGSINAPYSVDYATAAGTAAAGSDFTGASGTLVFGPDDFFRTVTIASVQDNALEADETFFVDLSAPSGGATLVDAQGQGTIVNEDTGNEVPIGNNDFASTHACDNTAGVAVNVIANDTDPDGDYPLILAGIQSHSSGYAAVDSATHVRFWPDGPGTVDIHYRVRDSRNALGTGRLRITVTGTTCQ